MSERPKADEPAARETFRALALQVSQAIERGDKEELVRLGGELLRQRRYMSAGAALAKAGLIGKRSPLPEWAGEPLAGRSILIVRRPGHIGAVIRMAQLASHVAGDAASCVAVVEPRLVALLARSFPNVSYRNALPDDWRSFDFVASYETLMQHLLGDDGTAPPPPP